MTFSTLEDSVLVLDRDEDGGWWFDLESSDGVERKEGDGPFDTRAQAEDAARREQFEFGSIVIRGTEH